MLWSNEFCCIIYFHEIKINLLSIRYIGCFKLYFVVYDHITLKTPVLVRSPKLSNVEPGQYLDGWPPGNTGCCRHFILIFTRYFVSISLAICYIVSSMYDISCAIRIFLSFILKLMYIRVCKITFDFSSKSICIKCTVINWFHLRSTLALRWPGAVWRHNATLLLSAAR